VEFRRKSCSHLSDKFLQIAGNDMRYGVLTLAKLRSLRCDAASFPRWVWWNLHFRDYIPIAEELEYVVHAGPALSLFNFQYCKIVLGRTLQKVHQINA
jgi:hypothetical protein